MHYGKIQYHYIWNVGNDTRRAYRRRRRHT